MVGGLVNIYVPADVPMREGDVKPFLDLLSRMLPVESDRAILLAYMAAVVQHPGAKFSWAPVLQGCPGNGKSRLISTLTYAVGGRYVYEPNAQEIGERFNSWLENKVLIVAEEIHMGERRQTQEKLKALITNRRIAIEGKGVDQRMIDNLANWAFCTNHKNGIIKTRDERRYAIFFTAQQEAAHLARDGMTGDYFVSLVGWLERGAGYAHVAHYLKHYAIPAALNPAGACNRAPETSSTVAAIEEARGPLEQAILEAIAEERVGFRGGWVSSWAIADLMQSNGQRKPGTNTLRSAMESLGYAKHDLRPSPILQEGGARPTLYVRAGAHPDYALAQGYVTGRMPSLVGR